MKTEQPSIETHLLPADAPFPNNPRLPLLLYKQAFSDTGRDTARDVERLLVSNGWKGTWRNGVYRYHHYHSNAHEVLVVCTGSAEVQFGGPSGPAFSVQAGDVAILPAGTAHKRLSASPNFLVVGAYPAGQERYDLMRGEAEEQATAEKRIAAVPLPKADPIYGDEGPLLEHWSMA